MCHGFCWSEMEVWAKRWHLKDGKEVLTVPLLAFGWVLWLKKKYPSRSGDICFWKESWRVREVNFLGPCGIDTLYLRWFILIVYGYSCPMWRKLKYWFKLMVMVVIKFTFCWAHEQWYEHRSLGAYGVKKAMFPAWIMHTHWGDHSKPGAKAQEFNKEIFKNSNILPCLECIDSPLHCLMVTFAMFPSKTI
jgi:hypothetical protein